MPIETKQQVRQERASRVQPTAAPREKTVIEGINSKKENSKEYVYSPMSFPFNRNSSYCPNGLIREGEITLGSQYPSVIFDHKLSATQCRIFDLRPDTEIESLRGKSYMAPSGAILTIGKFDKANNEVRVHKVLYENGYGKGSDVNYGWDLAMHMAYSKKFREIDPSEERGRDADVEVHWKKPLGQSKESVPSYVPTDEDRLKAYSEVKSRNPEYITLFRIGNFYDCYQEDAGIVSNVAGLVKTVSMKGKEPLATVSFPSSELHTILPKLIRSGNKAVLDSSLVRLAWEQEGKLSQAKYGKAKAKEINLSLYRDKSVSSERILFRTGLKKILGFNYSGFLLSKPFDISIKPKAVVLGEHVFNYRENAVKGNVAVINRIHIDPRSMHNISLLTSREKEVYVSELSARSLKEVYAVASVAAKEYMKSHNQTDIINRSEGRNNNNKIQSAMNQKKKPPVEQTHAVPGAQEGQSAERAVKGLDKNIQRVSEKFNRLYDEGIAGGIAPKLLSNVLAATILNRTLNTGNETSAIKENVIKDFVMGLPKATEGRFKGVGFNETLTILKQIQEGFSNEQIWNSFFDRHPDVPKKMTAGQGFVEKKASSQSANVELSFGTTKDQRESFRDSIVAVAGNNDHTALEVELPKGFNVINAKGNEEVLTSMQVLGGSVTFTNSKGEKLPMLALSGSALGKLSSDTVTDIIRTAKEKSLSRQKAEQVTGSVAASKEQTEQFTKDIKALMGNAKSISIPGFGTQYGAVASLGNKGVSIERVHQWEDNISFTATVPGEDISNKLYLHPKQIRPEFYQVLKDEVAKTMRPLLVTENGEKVTSFRIFEASDNPDKHLVFAKLDGVGLHPKVLDKEDYEKYMKILDLSGSTSKTVNDAQKELFAKYYPTKIARKLTKEEFSDRVLPNGKEISQFNLYKQRNPEKPHYNEYLLWAEVADRRREPLDVKASDIKPGKNDPLDVKAREKLLDAKYTNRKSLHAVPVSHDLLDAYFDRTISRSGIVTKAMGEQLHLAEAYQKYLKPEGIGKIRFHKNNSNEQVISAILKDGRQTPEHKVSGSDLYSYFKSKTVTLDQLAGKYLTNDVKEIAKRPMKVERIQALAR